MPQIFPRAAYFAIVAAPLLLSSCEFSADQISPNEARPADGGEPAAPPPFSNAPPPAASVPGGASARWDLQSSGEGVALALLAADGRATFRLFCPAGKNRLLVNVPAFRPIGSEERLSFGSGGEAVALVADSRGDRQRGGVSGTGEVARQPRGHDRWPALGQLRRAAERPASRSAVEARTRLCRRLPRRCNRGGVRQAARRSRPVRA